MFTTVYKSCVNRCFLPGEGGGLHEYGLYFWQYTIWQKIYTMIKSVGNYLAIFFLYLEQYLGKIYRKSPRILVQVSCQNRLCNCNVLRHLANDYLKTLLSDVICFMVEMVLFCKGWARDDKSTIKSQGRTSSNIIGVRLIYYHTC